MFWSASPQKVGDQSLLQASASVVWRYEHNRRCCRAFGPVTRTAVRRQSLHSLLAHRPFLSLLSQRQVLQLLLICRKEQGISRTGATVILELQGVVPGDPLARHTTEHILSPQQPCFIHLFKFTLISDSRSSPTFQIKAFRLSKLSSSKDQACKRTKLSRLVFTQVLPFVQGSVLSIFLRPCPQLKVQCLLALGTRWK